jgi:hypothetical protein
MADPELRRWLPDGDANVKMWNHTPRTEGGFSSLLRWVFLLNTHHRRFVTSPAESTALQGRAVNAGSTPTGAVMPFRLMLGRTDRQPPHTNPTRGVSTSDLKTVEQYR